MPLVKVVRPSLSEEERVKRVAEISAMYTNLVKTLDIENILTDTDNQD